MLLRWIPTISAMRAMLGKALPSLSACRPIAWMTAQSVCLSFARTALAGTREKLAFTVAMFSVPSSRQLIGVVGTDGLRHHDLGLDASEPQTVRQVISRELAGVVLVIVGVDSDPGDALGR